MKTTRRRLVARVDGEYGMVAQLRSDLPREIGGIYWVFQDNAYTSPYLPIFTGVTRIPEVYSTITPKNTLTIPLAGPLILSITYST